MDRLDLSSAPGWQGWRLGRFGRARDMRLYHPGGHDFTAAQILDNHLKALEVDALAARLADALCKVDAHAFHLDAGDVLRLHAAMDVLERLLPTRRWFAVHDRAAGGADLKRWTGSARAASGLIPPHRQPQRGER